MQKSSPYLLEVNVEGHKIGSLNWRLLKRLVWSKVCVCLQEMEKLFRGLKMRIYENTSTLIYSRFRNERRSYVCILALRLLNLVAKIAKKSFRFFHYKHHKLLPNFPCPMLEQLFAEIKYLNEKEYLNSQCMGWKWHFLCLFIQFVLLLNEDSFKKRVSFALQPRVLYSCIREHLIFSYFFSFRHGHWWSHHSNSPIPDATE